MRRTLLYLVLVAGILLTGSSCSTASRGVRILPGTQSSADDTFTERNAYIFINGKQKGITPASIQVRRSFLFGTTEISLHTGPKFTMLRKYEVEPTVTQSRVMADYTFGNEDHVFDISDLSKTKDGTYLIPYYRTPILVEDREFNLTIIVEE